MHDLKSEALKYSMEYHLPIIPLRGKIPITENGSHDATTDQRQISEWWSENPKANIGIATGSVIGIDLDQKPEEGKYGFESFAELESKLGKLPDTWEVLTGSGGRHLYFKCPDGHRIKNSASQIAEWIDIRGVGGYMVAPPSIHPDTGRAYEWECGFEPGEIPLAELPSKWLEAIEHPSDKEISAFEMPDKVTKGSRNDTLFRYGASLRAKSVPATRAYSMMEEFNNTKCIPPLSDRELTSIYDSVMRYQAGTSQDEIIANGQKNQNPIFNLISFADIEEKQAEWMIQGLIPKGAITSIAGDGGAGKTTVVCSIAAAVSCGGNMFLDTPFWERESGKVLIFSGEDSAEYVLKRRLRKQRANLNNIFTINISDKQFKDVKFGNPFLEQIIEQVKPDLVIFDPVQNFISDRIKMGDRNAMRQALIPVAGWGEKFGCTFLIVVHSNKQSGVWGRKRMADSSDLWDFSRSVLMVGKTTLEGVNYLSQEKSNYGKLTETHLFTLEDELIIDKGTSTKRDRDFVLEELHEQKRQAPARDNARAVILEFLKDGKPHLIKELDEYCKAMSIANASVRRAKEELKAEGCIKYLRGGGRSGEGWKVQKITSDE